MLPVLLQTFSNVRTAPEFLVQMEQFGLLDAVLPFIQIFAVIFTVLRKSGALGDKKNIHMLVALVISLLVVMPHVLGTYPPGQDVVNIINTALPNVSLVIVIIVAALILVGIFIPNFTMGGGIGGFLAIASLVVVIYIFGVSGGWWGSSSLGFLSNPDLQVLIVIVLVFAMVIYMITSESPFENIFGKVMNMLNKR